MSAGGGSNYFIPQGSDDFISPRSDNSRHSGTHSHSSSPHFVHGNSTHPSATGGNALDHVKWSYHPKINGKFIWNYIITLPCYINGNFIDPPMLPPPYWPSSNPDDWTPYGSQLEFETTESLFSHEQMSASNIDTLNLWSTSLFKHGDQPPFTSHWDLYDTIDVTPLGDVSWERFSVCYNGTWPQNDVLSWMDAEYEVWFCNPCTIIHNILSNPDFDGEFNYAPIQEYDMQGNHWFENFMLGDWVWKQVVSHNLPLV